MKLTGLAMAIGLVLATPLSPAQAASNLIFTKTDYPDFILRRSKPLRESEVLTAPLLAGSDIPQIKAYRDFLDRKARGLSRADQLAAVNDYVNRHVKQTGDYDLYLRDDIWATPVNTLVLGGDCEDIALVKRWGLARLGFPEADVYLVVGVTLTTTPPTGHAVLAVRLSKSDVRVLDSLQNKILAPDQAPFEPAYGLNVFGFWRVDTPGHAGGDYNQRALERALARQRR
ncbi:MAG: transglutaminase-like cysteine peptidase [Caulobacter sp.]|nr:transglutaminase-like cysteine peptidase [Caulobacter sp.]